MLRTQCTFDSSLSSCVLASPRGGVCVCVPLKITGIRLACEPSFSFSTGTQHFTGTVSNEATNEMGYPAWPYLHQF